MIALSDVLIEKKSIKLNDLRQYINLIKEILASRCVHLTAHPLCRDPFLIKLP